MGQDYYYSPTSAMETLQQIREQHRAELKAQADRHTAELKTLTDDHSKQRAQWQSKYEKLLVQWEESSARLRLSRAALRALTSEKNVPNQPSSTPAPGDPESA